MTNTKNQEQTETYYSPDKKGARKSLFIHYDKLKKLIKDNNKGSVEKLTRIQNPARLEFRIYATNSKWLHWDNLRGNYQQVFDRYKEYLATIYNNFIFGCLTVRGKENPNFKKITKIAQKNNRIKFRNKGGKLRQKETLRDENLFPETALSPHKIEEKKKAIANIFDEFSEKNVNTRKIQKMATDSIFLKEIRVQNNKYD